MGFIRKLLGIGPSIDEMIRNNDEDGLINLLRTSNDLSHKRQAISALGNLGSKKALPSIRLALQDPNTRPSALDAMQQLGDRPSFMERLGGTKSLPKLLSQIIAIIGSCLGLVTSTIALIGIISGNPTRVSLAIPLVSLSVGTISLEGTTTVVDIWGLIFRLGKWDLAGIAALFILVGTPVLTMGIGKILTLITGGDSSCLVIGLIVPLWFFFITLWFRAFIASNYLLAIALAFALVLVLLLIVSIPLTGGASGAGLMVVVEFIFTQLPIILIGLGVIAFIVWLVTTLAKLFAGS